MHPWTYIANALPDHAATKFLVSLMSDTPWQQHEIFIYGRHVKCPRLSAWYGDVDATYTYSGYHLQPLPWTSTLRELRALVELQAQTSFNSVLLNYYRDGNDSMGCHSDDEKELGAHPIIASLNLGAERDFVFKHKRDPTEQVKMPLAHASLLIMHAGCQEAWQHSLPKRKRIHEPRVNLTFRRIYAD